MLNEGSFVNNTTTEEVKTGETTVLGITFKPANLAKNAAKVGLGMVAGAALYWAYDNYKDKKEEKDEKKEDEKKDEVKDETKKEDEKKEEEK